MKPADENDSEPLVSLNMNMNQLNEYLQGIIKVVNQHAKVLQNVNKELSLRTTESQIGEIFQMLAKVQGKQKSEKDSESNQLQQELEEFLVSKIEEDQPHKQLEETFGNKLYQIDNYSSSETDFKVFDEDQSLLVRGTESLFRVLETMTKFMAEQEAYNAANDNSKTQTIKDI